MYQIFMNICKQREKKCGELIIRDIFPSPWAKTLGQNYGSNPNSNLICNLYDKAMYKLLNAYL